MSTLNAALAVATPGGALLVMVIAVPVAGVLLAFLLGSRYAERIVFVVLPVELALVIAIIGHLLE